MTTFARGTIKNTYPYIFLPSIRFLYFIRYKYYATIFSRETNRKIAYTYISIYLFASERISLYTPIKSKEKKEKCICLDDEKISILSRVIFSMCHVLSESVSIEEIVVKSHMCGMHVHRRIGVREKERREGRASIRKEGSK